MTAVNGYTDKATVKRRLGLPASDTDDDAAIDDAITSVSRDIDEHCSQHFYQVTEPRFFAPRFTNLLRFGDFNTLADDPTEVATDDDGDGTFAVWDSDEYQLLCKDDTPNRKAGPEERPFTSLVTLGRNLPIAQPGAFRQFRVRITGPWGWPEIPANVTAAANILAVETWKLKDAPFGALGMTDIGIIRVRDNKAAQIKLREYVTIPVA